MDFDLSEEQRMLKDSAERLLADRYDFEARRRHGEGDRGWSEDIWSRFAELGLLALPFAEEDGGIGGGPVETMIVMEALGGKLTLEPYLASVVLAGGALRRAPDALRAEWVPKIASGEAVLAFAHHERQARYEIFDVAATARQNGDGFILDGEKSLVLGGDSADQLVVSARVFGERRERGGIALFLVDPRTEGVTLRPFPTQDGRRAAEIQFSNVRVTPGDIVAGPDKGADVLAAIVDEAIAALCAEAVGAMAAACTMTVEYLKTRKQFGTTIGSFQALQHRAADMYVALEQARSMALFATMMAGSEDAAERAQAVSAAKVQIGRSARLIGQEAIQLHGGIGMTMETAIGHYFKRLTMIETMFGDADHHLRMVAANGGRL
ncbi:acyl-CoA dehydrogenase family protein [Aureimonas mangrovi]|uniref:acyl-CoA dehydrogenase family protein n=1 Tax=Aureimonas mangrovi TaxID=2758041 RepID=UPI00163D93A6|nr:acyl-CoA dehydrogenase family protein [Aureimonas mangrovi]